MIQKSEIVSALKKAGHPYNAWDIEEIQKLYKMRVTGSIDRRFLDAIIQEYFNSNRYHS